MHHNLFIEQETVCTSKCGEPSVVYAGKCNLTQAKCPVKTKYDRRP